jgi:endonuclease/exonuclease/phosphatase family metal-dependent hydrolase
MNVRILFLLPVALALVLLSSCSTEQNGVADTLNVVSYNIRYNNPEDGIHAWPNRIERVASTIVFNGADVIGVQEALHSQLNELSQELPGYEWIGVGRDDGKMGGEFTAVYYKVDRLEAVDSGTFWLSLTPDIPGSKDWDAAITRTATWVRFQDRKSGSEFYVFNTHFDHIGVEARKNSAKLIVDKIKGITGGIPVILIGDFNVTPDTETYAVVTSAMKDAMLVSEMPHHGPSDTFYGFEVTGEDGVRIDYIFVNDRVRVRRHATLSDNWNGAFASDHLAVYAQLSLNLE